MVVGIDGPAIGVDEDGGGIDGFAIAVGLIGVGKIRVDIIGLAVGVDQPAFGTPLSVNIVMRWSNGQGQLNALKPSLRGFDCWAVVSWCRLASGWTGSDGRANALKPSLRGSEYWAEVSWCRLASGWTASAGRAGEALIWKRSIRLGDDLAKGKSNRCRRLDGGGRMGWRLNGLEVEWVGGWSGWRLDKLEIVVGGRMGWRSDGLICIFFIGGAAVLTTNSRRSLVHLSLIQGLRHAAISNPSFVGESIRLQALPWPHATCRDSLARCRVQGHMRHRFVGA